MTDILITLAVASASFLCGVAFREQFMALIKKVFGS